MRLIDVEELNKDLTLKKRILTAKYGEYSSESGSYMSWKEVFDLVNGAPAVDAEPVRHGHWECANGQIGCVTDNGNHAVLPTKKCSECKRHVAMVFHINYCPYCGARMDEVEE